MPSWGEILTELEASDPITKYDDIRRKYLVKLYQKTGRPVILYATRFMQPSQGVDPQALTVSISDIQGLMEVMRGVESDGLDLIIHSPGGSIDAAEAFVTYLRSKFSHIRAFIPQAAMSAASMIACGADEIVMGKHSFLGPFDPQFVLQTPLGVRMVPAQAILEQFAQAQRECSSDQSRLASWVPMLSQYGPDLLVQCSNASALAKTLVEEWLKKYMYKGDSEKADKAATWLSTHENFKSHGRFLNRDVLREHDIEVISLEDDEELQDLVLSVYHATTHTFGATPAAKIIENHLGRAYLSLSGTAIPQGMPAGILPLPLSPMRPFPPAPQPPGAQEP